CVCGSWSWRKHCGQAPYTASPQSRAARSTHGSQRDPISPANWPGMMRPVRCTNVCGSTTAGGRLLTGRVAWLATAAMAGWSLGRGVGFQVEAVVLSQAAAEKDVDDLPGPWLAGL